MTLLGFFGADGSMASMRKFLNRQGYHAIPWGQGRNVPPEGIGGLTGMDEMMNFRKDVESVVAGLLEKEVIRSGKRVSLIGWSLGGLYATGLAHRRPDLVRQAITLGTPFSDPRGTSLYSMFRRVNQAEVTEETLATWTEHAFDGELEVPVTALYSQSDGFVGVDIAQLPQHELTENIAVMASHVGFPFNPLVRAVVAERLIQPEGEWKPYQSATLKPFVFKPA